MPYADEDNRLGKLLASGRSNSEIVIELYWSALNRGPSRKELDATQNYLERSKDRRTAVEDVAWSLLNSKEFLLRR